MDGCVARHRHTPRKHELKQDRRDTRSPGSTAMRLGTKKTLELGTYGPLRLCRVRVPLEELDAHLYMVGKTKQGKSKLLEHLARQLITLGQGCGVLDPHSDLADDLLATLHGDLADPTLRARPLPPARPHGLPRVLCRGGAGPPGPGGRDDRPTPRARFGRLGDALCGGTVARRTASSRASRRSPSHIQNCWEGLSSLCGGPGLW
jgi:hypothetical protein